MRNVLSYHEFFYEKLGDDKFFSVSDNKPYNMFFERPAMIEEFPELKGLDVLDAGAAAGWYSEYMYSHGANVTAIDISDNMLHLLKIRLNNKVNTVKCDISNGLPMFKDKSFDFIMSSLTLDYIKDWNLVFGEFRRLLKPNGILLFSVQHPFDDYSVEHYETYFDILNMEHITEGFGEKVTVWFYKRPLKDMVMPLINNGFEIKLIKEPKPIPKFNEIYPDLYQFHLKHPEYIIFKAVIK